MLKKILNYIKNSHFAGSFRFNRTFLMVVMYDTIFFGILVLAGLLFVSYLMPRLISLQNIFSLLNKNTSDLSQMQADVAGFKSEMQFLFAIIVVGLFVLFVSYTFFKSIAWSRLYSQKYNYIIFFRFVVVNLILYLIFLVVAKIVSYFSNQQVTPVVVVFFVLFYLYLVNIIYPVLTLYKDAKKTKNRFFNFLLNVLAAVKNSLKLAVMRIYKFILPYLIIILIFFIFVNLFPLLWFVPTVAYYIILMVVAILYLAWIKFYIGSVVKKNL